jgi:hypothetical protein
LIACGGKVLNLTGFAVPNAQAVGISNGWNEAYDIQGNMPVTNAGNTYRYAGVPTVSTMIKNQTSKNIMGAEDVTDIYFAACAGGASGALSGGNYQGKITLTAIADSLSHPVISSVSSSTGSMFGGTEITILGNNFGIKPITKYATYDSCGSYQTYIAANDGAYVLETWGANGGSIVDVDGIDDNSPSIGGYSTGTVNLSAGDVLYVYVGCAGYNIVWDGANAGGWNGGGRSNGIGSAGGDATDIRLSANSDPLNLSSLQSRIIVAGGGGGDAYSVSYDSDYEEVILASSGGAGGGNVGGDGELTSTQYVAATGGTQTTGGTPGYRIAEQSASTGSPGTFGAGGATQEVGAHTYNEGGGGGWFGGGAGASYDDYNDYNNIGSGSSGGGGSGYVFTSTSDKTGYSGNIPDSRFYLSSASTFEGGNGPTNPNGTGLVGGYATITNNDADIASAPNYQVILDPDGTPAPCNVTYWNNTQIICTTTTHAVGTVDVKVSNTNGWYTKTSAFSYEIPYKITGVALNFGQTTGGNSTTIFGSGFSSSYNLVASIGGIECLSTTYVSETALSCVTPVGTAGAKDVSIDAGNNPVTLEGGFTYMASSGNIQAFSASSCSSMPLYSGKVLTDARDSKLYRVKKMPDNKCWMVDNLAYIGGGTNTYGDTVPTGTSGAGVLVAGNGTTSSRSSNWTTSTGTTTRFYTNNSTDYVSGGTACKTDAATGTGTMTSACGNQILYNWCAAIGLDSSTTPTCSAATNTGYGTGYTETTSGGPKAGIIGKSGGLGGESKGNSSAGNPAGVNSTTSGSICPAGWRLPAARVGSSNTPTSNVYNDWNILNESFYTGTPFTNTTSTTINTGSTRYGYWQPAGTLPSGGAGTSAAFGAVSSGFFDPASGLVGQSGVTRWFTSSLYSSSGAAYTYVDSSSVGTGSAYKTKASSPFRLGVYQVTLINNSKRQDHDTIIARRYIALLPPIRSCPIALNAE